MVIYIYIQNQVFNFFLRATIIHPKNHPDTQRGHDAGSNNRPTLVQTFQTSLSLGDL